MRFRGGLIVLLAATAAAADPAKVCAPCHRTEVEVHQKTSMARALEPVESCRILSEHALLNFSAGGYTYTIRREGTRSVYSVSDGKETFTAPIEWAFGLGAAGQTYVFVRDGVRYESRVSFYQRKGGLDLTLGVNDSPPRDLKEAAGREMTNRDVIECFGCHSSGGVKDGQFVFAMMTPGLQCDNCHTGAAAHAAAISRGDAKSAGIAKLGRLNAEEMSDACGKCHRTWADIAANGPRGMGNVRFQPYRLANSRCYDALDARISCIACHDPHAEVDRRAAFYDSKCAACHAEGAKTARTCRIARTGCVTCHMPKYEIPGSHHEFSDHQIRIARKNESYPN